MAEELLDSQFLARLEYLLIVAREGFLSRSYAQRTAKDFGAGLEYADHREYAPGDDFRYIDWQVYARLDRLVVKMFSQHEELSLYLLLDASASMGRGRPQKALFAKQLLAALGYIALSTLDQVTVIPFDSDLRAVSNRLSGNGRRLELLRFLCAVEVEGKTDLTRVTRRFLSRFKRRGLVILASDFFDPDYPVALRMLHHAGFDCMALQVNDAEEVDPPFKGDLDLVDCESGERLSTRLLPAARDMYAEEWQRHYGELARLCRAFQQGHFATTSDTSLESLMLSVFRRSGFLR